MKSEVPSLRIGLSLALAYPPESLIHVGIRCEPGFFQLWEALHVSSALFIDACMPAVQWAESRLSSVHDWNVESRLIGAEAAEEKQYYVASQQSLSAVYPIETLNDIVGTEEKTVEVVTLSQTTLAVILSEKRWPPSESLTWLVVDCLPALPILRGAGSYLEQWSVIRCDVLVDDTTLDIPEARLSEVTDYLKTFSFRRAIVAEGWCSVVKTAWFVRDWRIMALGQKLEGAVRSPQDLPSKDAPDTVSSPERRPDSAKEATAPPDIRALRAEVELMRHELSVAQRNRYFAAQSGEQDGEQTSFSQLGQDLWVVQRLAQKKGGFFVDIGASDGILLNNTYLLEKQYGWRGICIEPNPDDHRALERNRACTVSNACVWSVTGEEMDFVLAKEFGALAVVANDDEHAAKRQAYRELGEVTRVRTTSLNDLLRKYEAPKDIDYISLDVEGAEFDILSTFDFAAWNVKLWTIEHNYSSQRKKIRSLMTEHGYMCQEAAWDDWYFRPGA